MEEIRILFIEDEKNSKEIFEDEVNEFNETNTEININQTIKEKIDIEVFEKILDGIDFIITDLRLLDGGDGNDIIKIIKNKNIVPLYVVTGYEGELEDNNQTNFYKIYSKGEENVYEKVLKDILHLYKTGITKVIGKHGKVNKILNKLIWNGGLDNIREWEKFDSIDKAEKSLGRYILSHIHHELSGDYEDFHPEEVYLKLMKDESEINKNDYITGTILEKEGDYFIVLTPACDIAQDRCDYFLVAEINTNLNDISSIKKHLNKLKNKDCKNGCFGDTITKIYILLDELENNIDKIKDIENCLEKIKKTNCNKDCKEKTIKKIKDLLGNYKSSNSKKDKFLPTSTLFNGGYIRFDRLHKINLSEIKSYKILCYVSEHFLADIIADFGYYYSRQGQPNLDDKIIIDNLLKG